MFLGLAIVIVLHAQVILEVILVDGHMLEALVQQDGLHRLTAQLGQFSLQTTHTRFAGVVTDNAHDGRVFDSNLALLEAIALDLLLQQVALGDVELLILGVTGQPA